MEAFLKGMRYFFAPMVKTKTGRKTFWTQDEKALAEDWKVIGADFRKVIKNYVRK